VGGYFSPWENPKLDPGPAGECLPLRLGQETAHFIEESKDEPFLAFLSFYSVHAPIQTSRERWEKYRRKAIAAGEPESRFAFDRRLPVRQVQDCPIYGGMIEAMDDAVGLVLAALDEHGLSDDTIVVFTSDNGGVSSGDAYSSSMLPLRGGKGRQWEGGIREPFYVRFPGRVEAGTTCDVPVNGYDFYPTFLEYAGVAVPEEQIVDGLSIVPLLNGETTPALEERDLCWHYPHYGNQGGDPSAIIRSGKWKLIHYYEDGHDELYDLVSDEGEQQDLASAHPDRVTELRRRLDRWLVETGAILPVADPEHDAEQEQADLDYIRTNLMARLEKEHAEYLDPNWEPNADWWGSQATID
jgi:arylsulfatase A-like enzyme